MAVRRGDPTPLNIENMSTGQLLALVGYYSDRKAQQQAIDELVGRGVHRAVGTLTDLAQFRPDTDRYAKDFAAAVLGRWGYREALLDLMAYRGAWRVGVLGLQHIIPCAWLIARLGHDDLHQRRAAAHAILKLGCTGATDALLALLAGDTTPDERYTYIQVLAVQKDPRVLPVFIERAWHDDADHVRRAAAQGIHRAPNMTDFLDALYGLQAHPDERIRETILVALTGLRGLISLEACKRALEDPSEAIRDKALNVLHTKIYVGAEGDTEALAMVRAYEAHQKGNS